MKRILIFASLAAAFMLTGCNKEEIKSGNAGPEVSLEIGEILTKTHTNTADNTTAFTAGDNLGVFSTGLNETQMTNVKFTVPVSGSTLETADATEYCYASGTPATFHAYYPYAESTAGTSISFTVNTDQSTTDGFNGSDFLTTPTGGITGSAETQPVLSFNHRLSLVKVVWTPAVEVAHISLNNLMTTVTWDYSTGTVTASGNTADIEMWRIADDSNEYWALVPAQTFQSGASKALITVTTSNNTTYQLVPTISLPFSEGKTKKITLSIEDEKLVVVVPNLGDIGNWDTSEEGEEPSVLISDEEGNFSSTTLATANGIKDVTSAGWHSIAQDKYASISIENGELEIINTGDNTTDNAWYRRGVVYRSTVKPTATSYTLKFKYKMIKGEDGKTPKLQFAVMEPEATTNTYFKLGTTTNANYIEGETNDYIERSFSLDLAEAGINSTTATTPNTEKGIILLFTSAIIDNATYYIDDVSIVETPLDGTATSVETNE